MRRMTKQARCLRVLAAALMWLLPVAIHARDVDKSPVATPAGSPEIVFENRAHDFGTVQPNTPLTHSFVFTNQGTAPLLIEKVKAGWGCTAALASASEIPPGGEGKITVTFTPGGNEDNQKKTVQVETNDMSARNLQLEVSAQVVMVLVINPASIVFPAFIGSLGSTEPSYARLAGSESASVTILSVESANKLIKVDVDKSGFDGDPSRQIRFSVRPGMAVGRFREQVVFKTDNTRVPSLNVYVMGEVTGTINVSPKHLPLGTITPGSSVRKTIQLQSTAEASTFNVVEVSSTVEGMATELITVTPGKEYQVVVSLLEGSKQPIIRGQIVIKTDDPEQEIITVRVLGRAVMQPVQVQPVMSVEPAAAGGKTVQ